MKRITLLIAMMAICMLSIHAKSYPFDMTHSYEVQIVRVAQQGSKFLKAWGIAGSPDKAIDRAMQDAVAACIFTGVEGNEIAGKIPALVPSKEAYEQHKQFFDTFFKKGEFLQYVKMPTQATLQARTTLKQIREGKWESMLLSCMTTCVSV